MSKTYIPSVGSNVTGIVPCPGKSLIIQQLKGYIEFSRGFPGVSSQAWVISNSDVLLVSI